MITLPEVNIRRMINFGHSYTKPSFVMKMPLLFRNFGMMLLALLFVSGMTLSSCGDNAATEEAAPEATEEAPAEQPAADEHPADDGHDHEHPAE